MKLKNSALTKEIKSTFWHAAWPGTLLVFCMAILHFFIGKQILTQHLPQLIPRTFSGLLGILFAPFIHDSVNHIYNNLIPLWVALLFLFWHYRTIGVKVFLLGWLFTGIWVWAGGRTAIHIGASGLVYAYMAFLIAGGFIRKNKALLALSLLLVTFYGGLIWGVFPIDYKVSWESHLYGAIAGLVLAFYYRKADLPKDFKLQPTDIEDEPDFDDWKIIPAEAAEKADEMHSDFYKTSKPYVFKYHFKTKD